MAPSLPCPGLPTRTPGNVSEAGWYSRAEMGVTWLLGEQEPRQGLCGLLLGLDHAGSRRAPTGGCGWAVQAQSSPQLSSAPLSHPRTLEPQILIVPAFLIPRGPSPHTQDRLPGPTQVKVAVGKPLTPTREREQGLPSLEPEERAPRSRPGTGGGGAPAALHQLSLPLRLFPSLPSPDPHVSSNGRGVTRA